MKEQPTPVPVSVEEAAKNEAIRTVAEYYPFDRDENWYQHGLGLAIRLFKRGAEWQAAQLQSAPKAVSAVNILKKHTSKQLLWTYSQFDSYKMCIIAAMEEYAAQSAPKQSAGVKEKLIEWTEWLGEMGWYKVKGKDRWEHDDENGHFESTKDLVEHYNQK